MTDVHGPARPLEGRVALVTGGSRGLGREMVRAFARAGAQVVIASRKLGACEVLAAELEESDGAVARPYACHVGRWSEIDPMIDFAYETFGRLDVVVNNAGLAPTYDSLETVSEELFDKVVGVNLKGPFRICAAAGARMKAAGGGSIINVSSTGSIRPEPSALPYAAAKAGLNALTSGFAVALGPQVRVNGILVGPFLTDMNAAWDPDAFAERAARLPLRRGGDPVEIAGTAVYLASDASSFTTGALLCVDGGSSLAPSIKRYAESGA